jgi:TRAP-type C4-dicarboxylate transport system permease small subunit
MTSFAHLLDRSAKIFAFIGGVITVLITLVTTGSIVGRWLFSAPLLGDTELVEFALAVAIAAFLPICQWRSANIIVDFFTSKASPRINARLDSMGAMLVALMMGLIAWRTTAGAFSQYQSGSTTMLLQWPEWIAYAAMVPSLALTAVIAVYMAVVGKDSRNAV